MEEREKKKKSTSSSFYYKTVNYFVIFMEIFLFLLNPNYYRPFYMIMFVNSILVIRCPFLHVGHMVVANYSQFLLFPIIGLGDFLTSSSSSLYSPYNI